MKERPCLTFNGNCSEAIELYKRAFKTDVTQVIRFEELSPRIQQNIPDDYKKKVMHATMALERKFIRMYDSAPDQVLNAVKMNPNSIMVETNVETVQSAFSVLAEEGRVTMPLSETFYSPCAGAIFDKFGVMWRFAAKK